VRVTLTYTAVLALVTGHQNHLTGAHYAEYRLAVAASLARATVDWRKMRPLITVRRFGIERRKP
jgi:hypothetical protein